MSGHSPVQCVIAGGVATITLNRPDRLNALDPEIVGLLLAAINDIANTPSARVVVLRGEGRAFCAGGDVAAMHAHAYDLPGFIDKTITPFHACVMAIQRLPMPVIASVQGALAGGGFSLAMACDFVIAARSARFVAAYAKLGAPADGGLSFFLVRHLGAAAALEALTTARPLDAEAAQRLGLVSRVADDQNLEQETSQWAADMLALPEQSLRELKTLVAVQVDAALETHLKREKAAFLRCAATPDFAARVAAFAQKRQNRV